MKHYARRTTLVLAASVTIALVLTATVTIALAYSGRSTSAAVAARAWPMPSVAPAQADGSATVATQKSGVLPAAPIIAARNSPPPPCDDSVCKAEAFGQQGLQSDFGPTVLSDFESGASDTQLGPSEMIVGAQTADGRDLFNPAPLGGFESASVAAPAPEISTAAMVALGVVLLITRRTGRSRWASWKAPWRPSAFPATC